MPAPLEKESFVAPNKREAKRVPFGHLLELGLLQPGQTLFLDKAKGTAKILADGTLRSGAGTGSIHQVGAQLLDVPALNGWEHWYYRDESTNELPIGNLRAEAHSGDPVD